MAARVAGRFTKTLNIVLGQCVPCPKLNAAKIKIKRLELDENLLMYFVNHRYVYATDPNTSCKAGDIVLIQEMPEKMTTLITHRILEIVYPLGDVTDPITGKKVSVTKYRDNVKEETEKYGKLDSTFDYDNAPPRGWLEGTKDLTDQDTYIKFHEDPNKDQPYAF